MPRSPRRTYTWGTETPEAMAISSTTFRSRRSSASRVPRSTRTPPASWATASPPPRIWSTPTSVRMPITASVTTVRPTYSPADGVMNPRAPTYRASGTTRLTARTTPPTASANSTTRSEVLRRARAWCSKNVTATTSAERDARRLALLRALGRLQRLRRREHEEVGDEVAREALAADVVVHHRVVVALARERDPVLGARQLFLQREHVLVGLQLRVRLDDGEQPPERARQPRLRLGQPAHRLRAAGCARRALRGLHGARAGRDDRVERLALVRHVSFGRLHEVGDQVVAPLELHVDLREGVAEPVAQ